MNAHREILICTHGPLHALCLCSCVDLTCLTGTLRAVPTGGDLMPLIPWWSFFFPSRRVAHQPFSQPSHSMLPSFFGSVKTKKVSKRSLLRAKNKPSDSQLLLGYVYRVGSEALNLAKPGFEPVLWELAQLLSGSGLSLFQIPILLLISEQRPSAFLAVN